MSVIFASGGIVSAVVTGGVSLVAVSTGAMLIQAFMKHKDVDIEFISVRTHIRATNIF